MRCGPTRIRWAVAVAAGRAIPALAEESGGHSGGLFVGDLGNLIWTLAIFVLLLVVLRRFAWGPLLNGLQRRERFIRDSLESAQRDREAAEQRLREYEARLREAREEAAGIVEKGRRDAEQVRRRIEEQSRASAEEAITRAKREIGLARDHALKTLYTESAELAAGLAASALKRQLTADEHERLIREAIEELGRRPGNAN